LKIMTKLIKTIYETGEWPKDFTEVTMIVLKKKPQAKKCSDHRTISVAAHTAKVVAKILRRRIEKKIEDVHGEDQFGFRRGKGTKNAIGMLRIIPERTLEVDAELCVCFIDWQKAVDQKHLESLEMWCWRTMEKISWTDRVRNKEVLLRVKEQRNILREIRKWRANYICHILRRNCLLQRAIEGKIKGDRSDRKTRKKT